MSLVNLANVCSHLQNASKARLGITSIPSTKQNLALALSLQKSGFISTVTRGGLQPPLLLTPTSIPHATDATAAAEAAVTQENVATRRLWLGMKYWNNEPVISEMKSESKPKKRVQVGFRALEKIVRGRQADYVKGLTRPGECLYLSTDRGIMEARDCVERRIGGLVLCRVV